MRTIMVLDFQLDSGFRVAGLSLDDNSALVHPESLVQVLVDEQSLISDVGRQHRGWEKEERESLERCFRAPLRSDSPPFRSTPSLRLSAAPGLASGPLAPFPGKHLN
ncbi:Protein of unknown function [Cotesia congregata]|uniref:Uncharacterized protein n=1 Tax=Cotesia congregata TaxID=51543 RepID=A0A8J2MRF1_COTCN|nr:Protein of unknown function [Cotesia congregata]